jgi:hypothetical protein
MPQATSARVPSPENPKEQAARNPETKNREIQLEENPDLKVSFADDDPGGTLAWSVMKARALANAITEKYRGYIRKL